MKVPETAEALSQTLGSSVGLGACTVAPPSFDMLGGCTLHEAECFGLDTGEQGEFLVDSRDNDEVVEVLAHAVSKLGRE